MKERLAKHQDLIVRGVRYSAFFNAFSRQTHNDIIEWTEQAI